MPLLDDLHDAPGWNTGIAAEEHLDRFAFPFLGTPWDHTCERLRSRTLTASVIIPTWNSAETLIQCLRAIELSSLNRLAPERLEVIVCDDGSSDNSLDMLLGSTYDLNLRAFALAHRSQSAALNVGIEHATGEIVILCDSDMLLGCGALDELVARHEVQPQRLCFGFRADLPPRRVPKSDDVPGLWKLIHMEAFSGDNRVRYHMPSLTSNRMDAIGWLTRLGGAGVLLDAEGYRWLRHRFVYGCLFSAERSALLAADGFPDALHGWGYNDALVAARLEAAGHALLPVTSAWGHHVKHELRHPEQWFQGSRNAIAHEYLLRAEEPGELWRAASGYQNGEVRPQPVVRSRHRSTEGIESEPVACGIGALHALGLWDQCLATPGRLSRDLEAEALFRLGQHDLLARDCTKATVWHMLSLSRTGAVPAARRLLEQLTGRDETADYMAHASPAELHMLIENYEQLGLSELAQIHTDALRVIGANPYRSTETPRSFL